MKTTNQPDAPNASANNAEQNLQQGQQPQQDPQRAQQPQQDQSDICCNNGNSNWKQQVAAAKGIWGKLTEDELLKSEGEQQKLSSLVRVRYVLSRETADKQVREFLARPQASNTSAA